MKELLVDTQKETERIITFLKDTFAKQGISNVVLGLSGGIDSTVSLFLLSRALPLEHIFITHLPYDDSDIRAIEDIVHSLSIPSGNFSTIPLRTSVTSITKQLAIEGNENVRIGNITARVRMIALFDMAKKHKAMVCGTENKSELLLGYFTRFGDQASDIEPLSHLYKTQVYQLARYLGVPEAIIQQPPTAGLWENQTDEKELGFSYREADEVLHLYLSRNVSVKKLSSMGYTNADKILMRYKNNVFKKETPYHL